MSDPAAAGCAGQRGLDGASDVARSPDGRHVYVAAANADAVAVLARTPGTGGACSDGRALWGASAVDVTGDGTLVVVAASTADAVTSFTRDPGTGALDAGACISESGTGGACGDGRALDGAADVVTAGHRAFVASGVSDGLAALVLDAATGAPAQPLRGAAAETAMPVEATKERSARTCAQPSLTGDACQSSTTKAKETTALMISTASSTASLSARRGPE